MPMKDSMQGLKLMNTVRQAQITSTATGDTIVDLRGYDSVAVVVLPTTVGACTDSNHHIYNVFAGDDSGLSDGANLAAADFVAGAVPAPHAATAHIPQIFPLAVRNRKRYARVNMTRVGSGDITCSVYFLLGNPRKEPV